MIAVLRDSARLLIVDEAHELPDVALRVLRDIHDTTVREWAADALKEINETDAATG